MQKKRPSGPAVFMYAAIAVSAVLSAAFLTLYYTRILPGRAVLWCGIVLFVILYQFGLRILFGEFTSRRPPNYSHPLFRPRAFEKRVFRVLHVREWKDRVLTFNPENYDTKTRTLHELASAMAKSELDHWFNVLLSLTMLLFPLLWGGFFAFFTAAVAAILFDLQFILVQRYNRPIVLRLIARRGKDALLR